MNSYYVARGRGPADLADGGVGEPGTTVTLDADAERDPHNARLIADGRLLKLPSETKAREKARRATAAKEGDR